LVGGEVGRVEVERERERGVVPEDAKGAVVDEALELAVEELDRARLLIEGGVTVDVLADAAARAGSSRALRAGAELGQVAEDGQRVLEERLHLLVDARARAILRDRDARGFAEHVD